jgi:hypothetical protein
MKKIILSFLLVALVAISSILPTTTTTNQASMIPSKNVSNAPMPILTNYVMYCWDCSTQWEDLCAEEASSECPWCYSYAVELLQTNQCIGQNEQNGWCYWCQCIVCGWRGNINWSNIYPDGGYCILGNCPTHIATLTIKVVPSYTGDCEYIPVPIEN